jgi:hypothetical protein
MTGRDIGLWSSGSVAVHEARTLVLNARANIAGCLEFLVRHHRDASLVSKVT